MPDSCCSVGCTNRRGNKPGLCFYRIPSEKENPERRRLWICAIKRAFVTAEGKEWQPSKYTRLCSEHFIKGAKSDDPSSPDWVPSVFLPTTATKKRKRTKDVEKYEQSKKEEEIKEQAAVAVLLKLSSVPAQPPEDEQKCDSKVCKEKIARLQKECNDLREENCRLKAILKSGTFHELALGKDDKKVKAMT
nr:THAP domain-containing protein 1-like [Misgurnus anguillicaudatus]